MKRIFTIIIVCLALMFSAIMLSAATQESKETQPTQNTIQTVYVKEECKLQHIDSTIPVNKAIYSELANQITEDERETLARLVYLEARGQSYLGQKAVVEVVLNRVLSDEFPNTIDDVIYQKNQFSPAKYIETTTPNQLQYDVVDEVLCEIYPVLNTNVLFFSTKQYNDLLYEQIGDHYFCYSTKSYEKQKGN